MSAKITLVASAADMVPTLVALEREGHAAEALKVKLHFELVEADREETERFALPPCLSGAGS